jgi:hypothetical protein
MKGNERMGRPCERIRLESGYKIDINKLARRGLLVAGARTAGEMRWSEYTGALVTARVGVDMRIAPNEGRFEIELGDMTQSIVLIGRPRHFGGHQWYFICPYLNRQVSVIWKLPGVYGFASRQRWGRQVGYGSQFSGEVERAHTGKAKIHRRLCSIGGYDPNEWEFPPKPKRMRWETYEALEKRFDDYEAILNEGLAALVAKLGM